jgi:hypothetical protein
MLVQISTRQWKRPATASAGAASGIAGALRSASRFAQAGLKRPAALPQRQNNWNPRRRPRRRAAGIGAGSGLSAEPRAGRRGAGIGAGRRAAGAGCSAVTAPGGAVPESAPARCRHRAGRRAAGVGNGAAARGRGGCGGRDGCGSGAVTEAEADSVSDGGGGSTMPSLRRAARPGSAPGPFAPTAPGAGLRAAGAGRGIGCTATIIFRASDNYNLPLVCPGATCFFAPNALS